MNNSEQIIAIIDDLIERLADSECEEGEELSSLTIEKALKLIKALASDQ
jgi:hypothetical protein